VVDEYGGAVEGESEMSSVTPRHLASWRVFLSAWSLVDVLKMNFEDDLGGALGFFDARSDFYPDFGRVCIERVVEAFTAPDN
jgi:hypothetical protein